LKINNKYTAHSTAIINTEAHIGKNTKIWHFSHIMQDSYIGENCNLGQNVVISPQVRIGNGVKIQNNVSVYTGVICEDDVFLGPSMVFTNVINPRSFIIRKEEFLETYIEQGATIGANATVICGNRIGKYAMIGAGAVITKNIPSYSLVVGNPAKQIGWVSKNGHRLHFNNTNTAVCPESNTTYKLNNNTITPL